MIANTAASDIRSSHTPDNPAHDSYIGKCWHAVPAVTGASAPPWCRRVPGPGLTPRTATLRRGTRATDTAGLYPLDLRPPMIVPPSHRRPRERLMQGLGALPPARLTVVAKLVLSRCN